jgi:arylsulfatase A-like enzyme
MSEVERVEVVPVSNKVAPCLLATAVWLGIVVGLLEVAVLLVEKQQNQVSMIGALRLNRHYPWMIPTAHLVLFGTCGLALEVIRRAHPGAARRIAPLVLGALFLLAILITIRTLHPLACLLLACGIASQLVTRFKWLWPPFSAVVRASLLPLSVGLILLIIGRHAQLAWAEHQASNKPTVIGSPNVLFIVLDTVRAKSLSLYGYGRETTPRLDRLARKGVKFEQAHSSAPWTLPSHATMFTGRWPSELFKYHEQRLDSSVPTLAGFLGRNGYATAGFVANTFYCNSGFGLSNGFDHYEDFYENFDVSPGEVLRNAELGRRLFSLIGEEMSPRSDGRKDADQINTDFLNWLSTRNGRPFFAFLNYLDAHAPYITPARAERHFGLRPTTPEDFKALHAWQKLEFLPPDAREAQLARDNYDDCIAYLDAALGRLFDELDRRGVIENTLVVVTSDHGEELGEHTLVGHGRSLYLDELHVPLLVVKPGRVPSGKIVAEPISLRDLPATIVDLVGLSNHSPFPGRSLVPLWSPEDRSAGAHPSVVRSEASIRRKTSMNGSRPPALRGPMVAIVAEGMSYIRNSDDREELYRLVDDPEQMKNLAGDEAFRPALERLRSIAGPTAYP